MSRRGGIALFIGILILFCCCLTVIVTAGGSVILYQIGNKPTDTPIAVIFPSTHQPASAEAYKTLDTIKHVVVSGRDLRDLALRFKGITDIPETVPDQNIPHRVGEEHQFWINNMDTDANFQIKATLRYVTDHAYFWIENDVKYREEDLQKLTDTFENKIYPTDREFFGSEWTPGIDNDPHLYIVFARGLGSSIAGYFSSLDSVPPLAFKYSNAHETFMMSADNLSLSDSYAYSVLAHEFQHMIHWYRDRNEETWLNEGFSELAVTLNGYETGGFDRMYINNPDMQLNDWPEDHSKTPIHYGASYLFVDYFLGRFGATVTQALIGDLDNGLDSIDEVLGQSGTVDAATQQKITADDVFTDWTIANYLDNSKVGDGLYVYQKYDPGLKTRPTETVSNCPLNWQQRTVHQYGVDYIKIACKGDYILNFEGVTEVGLLSDSPHSGAYAEWSNKGDESDMTLNKEFNFGGVSGALTLSYWVWYDLEKGYDYAYLVASEDGKTWKVLTTQSCMASDPSGNNYGCGYTGKSGGWKHESVDISEYAGKKVKLRFEYITDPAVDGDGLMLDDVSIPEIGYKTDFETDAGGWEANGFVRIENRLPQTYRVSMIKEGNNGVTVEHVNLDDLETFQLPVSIGKDIRDIVLVISGMTRFTRQTATYQFKLQP